MITVEAHQLGLFMLAFAVMVATPGPFVAAVAARSAAFVFRAGIAMALGAGVAEMVYVLLALLGLAALAATHGWALEALRYAGAAWLIWIGLGLLTGRAEAFRAGAPPQPGPAWRAFAGGLLINLGNPKTALFYMALFPGFFDVARLTGWDAALIVAVSFPIGMASDMAYAGAASKARRLLTSERSLRRMNRATGGVMVGAGAAIAAS